MTNSSFWERQPRRIFYLTMEEETSWPSDPTDDTKIHETDGAGFMTVSTRSLWCSCMELNRPRRGRQNSRRSRCRERCRQKEKAITTAMHLNVQPISPRQAHPFLVCERPSEGCISVNLHSREMLETQLKYPGRKTLGDQKGELSQCTQEGHSKWSDV